LTVVVLAALSVVAVGAFAERIATRGQAQTAADAAALAATTGGRAAAQRLASANRATVVSLVVAGHDVIVVVDVDGIRATAQATNGP